MLGVIEVVVGLVNTKSPQIVGLRPPMCWPNFLDGHHNANQLKILVHLQLLCAQRGIELEFMTSQRLSIQSVVHLPSFGRNSHVKLLPQILPSLPPSLRGGG